ncbi:MAG TPA: hypothetical protein VE172_00225 [Stackebrandtia sp.]|nr:hypothetical protein [Stackebrandtia sp.]HZE37213.1 hypothetical protein [Stackebrandtia sp.]
MRGLRKLPLLAHVGVMLASACAVAALAWWWFGAPDLSGPYSDSERIDVARIVLTIVGGLGGVVFLTVTYRRQSDSEAAERREDTRVFNERFGAAATQLASAEAANRLAGVYAMAGLADDWHKGRQTCINVLCAYFRMPYNPPDELPEDVVAERRAGLRTAHEERLVRHALLDTIAERLRAEVVDGKSWHGHYFDFKGAVFEGANFSIAKITGGALSFDRARFVSGVVAFREAEFSGGAMSFCDARFDTGRVEFYRCDFKAGTLVRSDGDDQGVLSFTSCEFTAGDFRVVVLEPDQDLRRLRTHRNRIPKPHPTRNIISSAIHSGMFTWPSHRVTRAFWVLARMNQTMIPATARAPMSFRIENPPEADAASLGTPSVGRSAAMVGALLS